jgi:hypothetical protein
MIVRTVQLALAHEYRDRRDKMVAELAEMRYQTLENHRKI